MTAMGHNIGAERLKTFIERIERLEEEKSSLTGDIREIYGEAKSVGYDTAAMRVVIKERKMDAAKRQEREQLVDLYRHAVGLLADTPLGQAGERRVGSSPRVDKAVKRFVDGVPRGGSVSIESGNSKVTVSKDAHGNVATSHE